MRPTAKSLFLPVFLSLVLIQCGEDSSTPTGPGPIGPIGPGNNNDVTVREPFSFNVAIGGQTRLRLEGVNGSVDISGSTSASTVVIAGERRVDAGSQEDAQTGLGLLQVNVNEGPDVISVRTIQPQSDGRNYVVDYRITLPRNLAVIVANVNGNIEVESINNRVSVANVNGSVGLSQIVGDAEVSVVNGAIDGRVTLPTIGTLELQTLNGAIDIEIPRSVSAQFVATTGNGRIQIVNLNLRTSIDAPNRVEGILGGGQGRITLGTTNGAITVTGF